MKRDRKILVLVLIMPLIAYSIPYAYAALSTATYRKVSAVVTVDAGASASASVDCNAGDVATGGGYNKVRGLDVVESRPTPFTGNPPTGWIASVVNPLNTPGRFTSEVVCMTPVTVAGIGVPEFGSLYVAIALGAIVYFVLSRHFTRRPSISVEA